MSSQALFGISVAVSFIAWAVVMQQYLWPALRSQSRTNALRPILLLHSFRFVGLAFLVPGVVSPDLPAAYARPAAYGDLATAILALLAIAGCGTNWESSWSGPSTFSAPQICSMPSTKAIARALASRRACKVRPTSFQPSWYHSCSSATVLSSGSCFQGTTLPGLHDRHGCSPEKP
jgi:hypothetical protein